MRLYYTSSTLNTPQTKPSLSLGGYKAVSPIPNDQFGNLFGDISMYTVKNAVDQHYIGLILVNEKAAASSVYLWFEHPEGAYSKMRVAAVDLLVDPEGNQYMEQIPAYTSKPLYAEFHEANGEANKVDLGPIPAGGAIALWINRELNLEVIKEEQGKIFEPNPLQTYIFQEIELAKEDSIAMVLDWI